MSLVDRAANVIGMERAPRVPDPVAPPPDVTDAIRRGRREMTKDAAKRRLCMHFERGDTHRYLNSKNGITANSTVSNPDGTGKPRHRMRNSFNHIRPLVEDKVSAATSRIPSYEVVPSTSDPDDRSAAGLSQKVALYGYDRWGLRKARMKAVKSAIAHGGDGFLFPYFEPDVGPYTLVEDKWVGQGEIRVLTLGGNEVYWEAGVTFELSRWWVIERARPIADVKATAGFAGGQLSPDASTSDVATDDQKVASDNLVMVTDYFERPCPKWPEGRRIQIANGREIVDWRLVDPTTVMPWEPYPLRGHDGKVIDEPLILRLSYTCDPDSDRDLGLVWQLIDPQRTIDDCINKLLEWKNRCLNPQMKAPVNGLMPGVVPNDEPGFVYYYRMGMNPPETIEAPHIPQELFQIYSTMREAMQFFASYADASSGPDVAAKTLTAAVEQTQARWQSFLGDLAEVDSRLMRHCLMLVARYYTEPRLLKINGWFGPDRVEDFLGSQLNGQVDVTVLPGSLTQLSKGEMLNRIQFIASTWPGWLSPEMALAAMDGGAAANLVQSYELDVARIDHIIMSIRDGTIMDMPTRQEVDPDTGQPLMAPAPTDPITGMPTGQPMPAEVPSWMPMRDVDNLAVWKRRIGDWMKTEDFERMTQEKRAPATMILTAINKLEADAAAKQAAQMQSQAQDMGMSNAVKPAGPKALPSAPAPDA